MSLTKIISVSHLTAFIEGELEDWVEMESGRRIHNSQLLNGLGKLGQCLVNRVRNYVQTRQRALASHLKIGSSWLAWFYSSEMKSNRVNFSFDKLLTVCFY